MDKTEENLKRIRAYDAEQWRTIKGAHVLVGEDGTVKAGAGGKFNGQKFGQSGGSSSANSRILKSMGGNWSKGKINGYEVEVKHFNSESMFGIGAGKISKLTIKKDGKTVANYDRGWDIKPQNKSASAVYQKVLEEIDGDSSGKMTAGAGMSKTQAMKNLASAANPESKKVPAKSKSVGMKDLKVTQEAYLDGYNKTQEANEYKGIGKDKNGNEYEITWLELDDFDPACGDESQACDWNKPYSIKKI